MALGRHQPQIPVASFGDEGWLADDDYSELRQLRRKPLRQQAAVLDAMAVAVPRPPAQRLADRLGGGGDRPLADGVDGDLAAGVVGFAHASGELAFVWPEAVAQLLEHDLDRAAAKSPDAAGRQLSKLVDPLHEHHLERQRAVLDEPFEQLPLGPAVGVRGILHAGDAGS